jgi:tyrosyl-tRNA synthetase
VVGSFTATIGDPTGRDAQREPLTVEQVRENFVTYQQQAGKILDFSRATLRYNHEWLAPLGFEQIVQLASAFTVQQMLERDMFEKRLAEGKPIGVHEFLYPLMVGYDSVVLDVDAELGGNDQYFNMLAGRTLQQVHGKREKFVLTTKLIPGTDGRKMSKTYGNCVYLDDAPGEMFGRLMSIPDEQMATYFECCTDVPMAEISAMTEAMRAGANPRDAKVRLAQSIVTLYHGAEVAEKAVASFASVFSEGGVPEDVPELRLAAGAALIDVLIAQGLIASRSEAKRLIEQKGITLNNEIVQSMEVLAVPGVVRVGKRRFLKLIAGA